MKPGNSKIKVLADLGSSEGFLPGLQMAIFYCILTWPRERESKFSPSFSYKGVNSTMRAPPLCPNYFPIAPSPNIITWQIRVSTYGGHEHSIFSSSWRVDAFDRYATSHFHIGCAFYLSTDVFWARNCQFHYDLVNLYCFPPSKLLSAVVQSCLEVVRGQVRRWLF